MIPSVASPVGQREEARGLGTQEVTISLSWVKNGRWTGVTEKHTRLLGNVITWMAPAGGGAGGAARGVRGGTCCPWGRCSPCWS